MSRRMRLLVEIEFPFWRLRNWSNERAHWAVRRRASQPPVPGVVVHEDASARVLAPHPRRRVEITRIGKKMMDEDGLASAMKPVLDRLKTKRIKMGSQTLTEPGWIFDDSPRYCKLVARQEIGPEYGVRVRIFGACHSPTRGVES